MAPRRATTFKRAVPTARAAPPRSKDTYKETKPNASDLRMRVLGEQRRKQEEDKRRAALAKGKGKASASAPPAKKQKMRRVQEISSSEDDKDDLAGDDFYEVEENR